MKDILNSIATISVAKLKCCFMVKVFTYVGDKARVNLFS